MSCCRNISHQEKVAWYKRVLNGVEYRQLSSPLDQALALFRNEHLSYRVAAEAAGVSKSKLERAVKCNKEGRKIGVNGRPRILTDVQEKEFVSFLEEKASNERVDYKIARSELSHFWTLKKDGFQIKQIPVFSTTYIRDVVKRNDGKVLKVSSTVEPDRVVEKRSTSIQEPPEYGDEDNRLERRRKSTIPAVLNQ